MSEKAQPANAKSADRQLSEAIVAHIKTANKPALEQLVDAFFEGLEARIANPIGKGVLQAANTVIDMLIERFLTPAT